LRNTAKIDKLDLLFYSGAVAFVLMIPIWWNSEANKVIMNGNLNLFLIYLFLLNGFTHFTQAILAFSVLSIVTPITYSIASLIKRIFVIAISIFWFSDKVNFVQGLGIAITFFGLYLYQLAEKDVEKNERKILEYRGKKSSVSLPLFSNLISKQ
jgi:drug/metabolite transporter (DMT)-like permease